MGIKIEQTRTGGQAYGNPFVGPINHTAPVRLDVSGMDNTVVDARGFLKPGVLLRRNGTLVGAVAGAAEAAYGANVEAVKVAASNSAPDLAAAVDIDIAVATVCQINRAILEDNLGRALTAGELASTDQLLSSPIVLVY